jgi:hypothetical protein
MDIKELQECAKEIKDLRRARGKQVAQAERHPGYGVMPIVCRGEDFIDMLLTREKTDKI